LWVPDLQFQFHSGSIQTLAKFPWPEAVTEFQFHSGSIQTVSRCPIAVPFHFVSIPLWFDSNSLLDKRTITIKAFQFHSGSIQTIQQKLARVLPYAVSIPLWFDSNHNNVLTA